MKAELFLREVIEADLPVFFEQQLDPEANRMAAFTVKEPANREAFDAYWKRNLANPTGIVRTIVVAGQVVGSVSSYEAEGKPEVTYWIGKEFWGHGYATQALAEFLVYVNTVRPIHARVAKDNAGSLRVLEKCGFTITGEDRGFANARGEDVEEWLLTLYAAENREK